MNTWTTLKRITTAGAKNFARGGAVTVATVLIMTVTLGIIGSLIFVSVILNSTLNAIKEKVDVNVYFVTTASDEDIQNLISKVKQLPQVADVVFTSRDEA